MFLRDLQSGTTIRVSVGPQGEEGNGVSTTPAISADGAFVVYASFATNLVSGDTPDQASDVFIWERATAKTTRLAPGFNPAISGDGSIVAFTSNASNLVPADTNNTIDEFVIDRGTGLISRVSVTSAGVQGTQGSAGPPSLSADGRYVLFSSYDRVTLSGNANGANLFVHDRQTHTTIPVSIDESGKQVQTSCLYTSISNGGRYIAFTARSSTSADSVFVFDLQTGTSKRVYGSWSYLCSPVPANDFQHVVFTGDRDIWLGLSQ